MDDCLFCKIVAGEIPCEQIYSDALVLAFNDINPVADTHILIIPRQHIRSLNDLRPDNDAVLAHMMQVLPKIAQQQGLDNGYRTIINTEKGGGQVIFHLHIHLLAGKNLAGFH